MNLRQAKQGCGLAGTETSQLIDAPWCPRKSPARTSIAFPQPLSPNRGLFHGHRDRAKLPKGLFSLLESPGLLARHSVSFLVLGKATWLHQIFRLRVCGRAEGKMWLTAALHPLVMGRAMALSPRDPHVGQGKSCLPMSTGQGG